MGFADHDFPTLEELKRQSDQHYFAYHTIL